jgi:hypothetical protein
VVRAHRDAVVSKEQPAEAPSSGDDTPPAGGPGTGLDGDPGPKA